MQTKMPQFKRYIPESVYFSSEEQPIEEELTSSELALTPGLEELLASEDISALEGPEKPMEFSAQEKLQKPSEFVPFESLKIITSKQQEVPIRIMTSKHERASKAHGIGFPEQWYEDADLKNVEEAIKHGAPVNQPVPIHPLRYAVYTKNIPLIKLLLEHGSRADIRDMSGFTAKSTAEMKLNETRDQIYEQILNIFEQPVKQKAGL